MRRIFFAVIAAGAASFAFAGVNFFPHHGLLRPNYFSGTNSRASYYVELTAPHNHIRSVSLKLNGLPTQSDRFPWKHRRARAERSAEG